MARRNESKRIYTRTIKKELQEALTNVYTDAFYFWKYHDAIRALIDNGGPERVLRQNYRLRAHFSTAIYDTPDPADLEF